MLPVDLPEWLHARYGFDRRAEVTLLRSYTNDVYAVTTAEAQFVLKIYGMGWRSRGEIQYEIDLILHLARHGLAVAKPIPAANSELLQRFSTGLGQQFAVLFEYAAGEKPKPPFTPQLYGLFGEAIGRMHTLSDSFTSPHRRRRIDLALLLDRPLPYILPLLAPPEAEYVRQVAQRIRRKLKQLGAGGLDWGPIHGDATLDNLHLVDQARVVLYDFDSGGPGWRASDLQGWAIGYPEYQERYDAFCQGYRQARALTAQDVEASWYLTLAWDIWGMAVDLQRRVLRAGQPAIEQYLAEQVALLRWRERWLPR